MNGRRIYYRRSAVTTGPEDVGLSILPLAAGDIESLTVRVEDAAGGPLSAYASASVAVAATTIADDDAGGAPPASIGCAAGMVLDITEPGIQVGRSDVVQVGVRVGGAANITVLLVVRC